MPTASASGHTSLDRPDMLSISASGGFDMSGTNGKAGGEDYLKLFLQAKIVSERV